MNEMNKISLEFKICPGCSYSCTLEETHTYCPYCGEKLINTCPNCEAPITTPYANYCTKCGSLYPGREVNKSFSD